MPRLDQLPAELLLQIIEEIPGQYDSQWTLVALCSTSRRIRLLTEGYLYRNIQVRSFMPAEVRRANALIRTLLKRPELAANIESLWMGEVPLETHRNWPDPDGEIIPGVRNADWMDIDEPREPDHELAMLVQRFLHEKHSVYTDHNGERNALYQKISDLWLGQACSGGRYEWAGGLLLSLLPNLKELEIMTNPAHIWFGGDEECYVLTRLFSLPIVNFQPNEAMSQINMLRPLMTGIQNVQSLCIRGYGLSILNLPFQSVTQLELDLTGSYFVYDRKVKWLEARAIHLQYPNLKTLVICDDWDIMHVDMEDPNLIGDLQPLQLHPVTGARSKFNLLASIGCTNLQSFWYKVRDPPTFYDGAFFFFGHLINRLSGVRNSLKELRIDCERFHGNFNALIHVRSLNAFTRLKKVHILQRVIVPRRFGTGATLDVHVPEQVFPPTLESLTLTCPDPSVIVWLERLTAVTSAYPNLKEIALRFESCKGLAVDWFTPRHQARPFGFVQTLASRGISFEVQKGVDPCDECKNKPPKPNVFWNNPHSDGTDVDELLASGF